MICGRCKLTIATGEEQDWGACFTCAECDKIWTAEWIADLRARPSGVELIPLDDIEEAPK